MSSLRSARRPLLSVSALTLALAAGSALAAPVKGKVELPTASPDLSEIPHHVRAKNGFIPTVERIHEPSREVTVAITREGAESQAACDAQIENGGLIPHTLIGAPGASIVITNRDATEYGLVAEGLTGLDGAPVRPGHAAKITLAGEGVHELVDTIHPHVRGHVVALPGLVACAEMNDKGAFRFEQVEPGDYTVHYFVDGQARATQPLTVPPPGYGTVTLPPISLSGAR